MKSIVFVVLLGFALVSYLASNRPARPRPLVEWIVIDVNSDNRQGDAHLLRLPDNRAVLIDVGYDDQVVARLRKSGIAQVDQVFVTHWHKDHYGGLKSLLESHIAIREIRANIPPRDLCEAEVPWGCDFADVQSTIELVRRKKVPMKPVRTGEVFSLAHDVSLEVVYASDGAHPPVVPITINDMSLTMRLSTGRISALFTGDLNGDVAESLAEGRTDLKADILKVPHHGVDLAHVDSFFGRVSPRIAIVPAYRALWLGDRAKSAREYLQRHEIKTYVSGLDGEISVEMFADRFEVEASSRGWWRSAVSQLLRLPSK